MLKAADLITAPDEVVIKAADAFKGVGAIYLTKTISEAEQHRVYRLEIVQGLSKNRGIVRELGRIGRSGPVRTDWSETESEATDARFPLHMQKAKRGYI